MYDIIHKMLKSLVDFIFEGSFSLIDGVVGIVKDEASKTPAEWSNEIFTLIENIIQNVMIPIGAIIMTLLILHEFISALMEKNNFHEFDMSIFLRFIFKSTLSIWFLSNTFTIVNAIFDVGTWIVTKTAGTISQSSGSMMDCYKGMQAVTTDLKLGELVSLIIPAGFMMIVALIIVICTYVILFGRMIEIYIYISVAPIPMATVTHREFGDTGKNYLKSILAFALQGFFIILCVGIYALLIKGIPDKFAEIAAGGGNVIVELNGQMMYIIALGVVLIFSMFKSGSVAKSIVGAH